MSAALKSAALTCAVSGERMRRNAFKVGDWVWYIIPPGGIGNSALEGRTGTVVYIDGSRAPITIRLDESYIDAVSECRLVLNERRRVILNCWFCKAENLERLRSRPRAIEPVDLDPAGWISQSHEGRPMKVILKKGKEESHGLQQGMSRVRGES